MLSFNEILRTSLDPATLYALAIKEYEAEHCDFDQLTTYSMRIAARLAAARVADPGITHYFTDSFMRLVRMRESSYFRSRNQTNTHSDVTGKDPEQLHVENCKSDEVLAANKNAIVEPSSDVCHDQLTIVDADDNSNSITTLSNRENTDCRSHFQNDDEGDNNAIVLSRSTPKVSLIDKDVKSKIHKIMNFNYDDDFTPSMIDFALNAHLPIYPYYPLKTVFGILESQPTVFFSHQHLFSRDTRDFPITSHVIITDQCDLYKASIRIITTYDRTNSTDPIAKIFSRQQHMKTLDSLIYRFVRNFTSTIVQFDDTGTLIAKQLSRDALPKRNKSVAKFDSCLFVLTTVHSNMNKLSRGHINMTAQEGVVFNGKNLSHALTAIDGFALEYDAHGNIRWDESTDIFDLLTQSSFSWHKTA